MGRKGFTLIELIIVVIIVGILAAIAGPMLSGNVLKAKKSEAVAALGSIRTAERLYFAENNCYVAVAAADWGAAAPGGPLNSYVKDGDLTGKYYIQSDYSVALGADNQHFTITANNAVTSHDSDVTMTEAGIVAGY